MPRLRAMLLHGLGNGPGWWDPVAADLRATGIDVYVPAFPDPATSGPEQWVAVAASGAERADLLIGHSLGAAVALVAAVRYRVANVICMAMPAADRKGIPALPPDSSLSATALARIGLFLKAAGELKIPSSVKERVHLIGGNDSLTNGDVLAGKGFHCVTVPTAGHELNRSTEARALLLRSIAGLPVAVQTLDPAVRRSIDATAGEDLRNLGLGATAPPPSRLDIEITSRCNCSCRFCGRTLYRQGAEGGDMSPALFTRVLDYCDTCGEAVFVGLGEPLLHPDIEGFIGNAHRRGMRTRVVTNGTLAAPDSVRRLASAGCDELTFSVDAANEPLFSELRGGASLEKVVAHLRRAKRTLPVSMFVALSRENSGELDALIDLAVSLQLPALTVSDLNFPENVRYTCSKELCASRIAAAIRHAREHGILLLGPHIHDFPTVTSALRRSMITSADDLMLRPERHTHCLAPWRILVVGANGEVTPCNCAPETVAGTIQEQSPESIWNGEVMQKWRSAVLDGSNERCRSCPRY